MNKQAYGYAALAMFCLGISPVAQADLKPISDDAMGEVTGQAFMQVENIAGENHNFTRMSLGMDVETRFNVDDIQVGQIDGGTDFSATHLALGHIARADGEVFNGRTYNEGQAIPFEAQRPYIELAEDAQGLAGFRMGFQQARGSVTSNTTRFSGNLPGLKIREDVSGTVYDAALFDGEGETATNYRASHIGIAPTGSEPVSCVSDVNCAPLTNLRSVIVGEDTGTDGDVGFTDGFFIGFQRDGDVSWQSLDGANAISVGKGVFINLPTNMTVDLSQLTGEGVDRLRTHQVDMGTKLF
ncbi:MAG: hypothetical protein HLUCCX14_10140 [Marinobacter excellens HL-55]|uniref:Uncharacterized protein n=1 Tax=Marinobacter excellens HL-55 TaxID=1305731 RepID=A0A0N8KKL7_9GAMM|nr:MAG: hypothetical protein HLUCCX14_10140 [Marinobacter excellens HL-55]